MAQDGFIKAELQDDHPGKTIGISKVTDLLIQYSQVFCDKPINRILAQELGKEILGQGFFPRAINRIYGISGHFPIVYQSDKVVKTQDVVKLQSVPEPIQKKLKRFPLLSHL